VGSQLAYMG
jgi:hypothetical protein